MSGSTPITGANPGDAKEGTPPSDLDLMLWVDGELDARRALEVEAFVRRDTRARSIVIGLRTAGDLLAANAVDHAEASGGDSIADNVMDVLEAEASRRLIAPVRKAPAWRAPAATAAGLALAFAAAWMLFIRNVSFRAPSWEGRVGQVSFVAPRADESALEDWAGAVIEVVDFGTRPGAIFYVPSEGEGSLAVVWLTDDDSPASSDAPMKDPAQ